MEAKKINLLEKINLLDMDPKNIERGFAIQLNEDSFETSSPWDEFIKESSIHLGKRSSGWKFCWNFHNNRYYSNREELLSFIRSGRVVNEYGEEQEIEIFIDMALNWDGIVYNMEYIRSQKSGNNNMYYNEKDFDTEVDGLRVSSSTDFS